MRKLLWLVVFILLTTPILPAHAKLQLIERNRDWNKYGDNVTMQYDPETHTIDVHAIPVDLHSAPLQINYLDDNDTWQPINTTLVELKDGSLIMEKAPYKLQIFSNRTGYKVYPDRKNSSAWLEFRLPEYFYENTTKQTNDSTVSYIGDNYTLNITSKETRTSFEWVIKNQSVFNTLSRNFSMVIIPHNTDILSNGTIEGFNARLINRITDADGTTIIPEWTYNSETHILSFYINDSNLTYPIVVDPTVDLNPGSNENDGFVYGFASTYINAHDYAYGYDNSGNFLVIGQRYYNLYFYVFRVFLKFDTSKIPSSATITSAKLRLYGYDDGSTTDFYIRLQKWTGDTPIDTGDYNQFDGKNYDDGNFYTSSWSISGYNNITISDFSLINKGGYTKICVRSSRDISSTSPTGDEWVRCWSYNGGSAKWPILHIEYVTNNKPELKNPSVTPSSGVADYTTFYFNITWADADGDSPADGYLKVNISKTGWYTNVSMTYVSGDNTTGALYTYSTTLSAGTYQYTFYAYDGTDTNSSGPHSGPSVSAQDLSFTVYTSTADGNISFTATVTPGQGLTTCYNISATGQDSTTPALKVTNTGNVPLNFTWRLNNNLPSGLQLKYNYTNNPPPHNQNVITTTEYQFATSVPVGADNKTWMWMDFINQYGGSGQENMTINSTFGG